jgi:hypothetical protein
MTAEALRPPPAPADLAAARADREDALLRDLRAATLACASAGLTGPLRLWAGVVLEVVGERGGGEPPRGGAVSGWPARELREEAEYWAAAAARSEIEAYLVALLREAQALCAPEAPMAAGPRRRLFAALWNAMPEVDRREFLLRAGGRG